MKCIDMANKKSAVKKNVVSSTSEHEGMMFDLGDLWRALEDGVGAEAPKNAPNSINESFEFEWRDRTKGMKD